MIVHEVFAQIFEEEVRNIIVCDNYPTANYLTKAVYGPTAFAVDCLRYSVGIGDKYHDGYFWVVDSKTGNETEIYPLPTEKDEILKLKGETNDMVLALSELIGGVENA